ncbi:uncharacterized protein BDR25DRAFT_353917 [Lindgomyces ingoldianus]|uniref:Uncharacterized protein n=1 Tax=Lindgomyces ingoldianus TaxID=673940 RepID=A0ACB6QZE8_9PLEO|nr:uncharacterized protein BDR25DRAFT_353917 [Lindgomyces ingoldianus]KAF2472215.1 hypothetical protein BDR25DRAFT_353917 [Lindgomyces ingoldianus]
MAILHRSGGYVKIGRGLVSWSILKAWCSLEMIHSCVRSINLLTKISDRQRGTKVLYVGELRLYNFSLLTIHTGTQILRRTLTSGRFAVCSPCQEVGWLKLIEAIMSEIARDPWKRKIVGGDLLHDEEGVIDVVKQWHQRLRITTRQTGHITKDLLTFIKAKFYWQNAEYLLTFSRGARDKQLHPKQAILITTLLEIDEVAPGLPTGRTTYERTEFVSPVTVTIRTPTSPPPCRTNAHKISPVQASKSPNRTVLRLVGSPGHTSGSKLKGKIWPNLNQLRLPYYGPFSTLNLSLPELRKHLTFFRHGVSISSIYVVYALERKFTGESNALYIHIRTISIKVKKPVHLYGMTLPHCSLIQPRCSQSTVLTRLRGPPGQWDRNDSKFRLQRPWKCGIPVRGLRRIYYSVRFQMDGHMTKQSGLTMGNHALVPIVVVFLLLLATKVRGALHNWKIISFREPYPAQVDGSQERTTAKFAEPTGIGDVKTPNDMFLLFRTCHYEVTSKEAVKEPIAKRKLDRASEFETLTFLIHSPSLTFFPFSSRPPQNT